MIWVFVRQTKKKKHNKKDLNGTKNCIMVWLITGNGKPQNNYVQVNLLDGSKREFWWCDSKRVIILGYV